MKAKSDKRPLETEVETLDNGNARVFLRENITEMSVESTEGGQEARTEFGYEEFTIETAMTPELLERVERNRAVWLEAAKKAEKETAVPPDTGGGDSEEVATLKQKVAELEGTIADMNSAIERGLTL